MNSIPRSRVKWLTDSTGDDARAQFGPKCLLKAWSWSPFSEEPFGWRVEILRIQDGRPTITLTTLLGRAKTMESAKRYAVTTAKWLLLQSFAHQKTLR